MSLSIVIPCYVHIAMSLSIMMSQWMSLTMLLPIDVLQWSIPRNIMTHSDVIMSHGTKVVQVVSTGVISTGDKGYRHHVKTSHSTA